jgi:hypothetical protein
MEPLSSRGAVSWGTVLDLLRGQRSAPQRQRQDSYPSPQARPWELSMRLLAGEQPPCAPRRFESLALRSPVLNVQDFIASSHFD